MPYKPGRIVKVGGLVGIIATTSLYVGRCVANYAYNVDELPVKSAFDYREMLRADPGGTTYDDGLGIALGGLVALCVAGVAGAIWALARLNSELEDMANDYRKSN